MPTNNRERKPGDLIIDRYMPNASEAEREEARENLKAHLAVVYRIAVRVARDEKTRAETRANPNSAVDSEDQKNI